MDFNKDYMDLIEKHDDDSAKEKVLEVKNLTISFKTDNGKVQAVRGVSFDLYKGETLCIVGESGSGKSVTSKAIMGILSTNAIVEGGQIIYEGEDLLKVSEDEFHRIRGHKIGMIFQDPLSSLNPIVKIGKQITETMMINKDQLKNYYNELIAKELTAYKNNKVIRSATSTYAQSDFEHECALIDEPLNAQKKELDEAQEKLTEAKKKNSPEAGELQKAYDEKKAAYDAALEEANKKKKDAKEVRDQKIKAANEEYKKQKPGLKEALKKKKAEAKVETAKHKAELEKTRDEKLKVIEEERKGVHIDEAKVKECDDRIAAIKRKYIWPRITHFFHNRGEVIAQCDAEVDKVMEERKQYTHDMDIVDEKEAEVNREYINATKITKAEAKRHALEVMKEVGIPQAEKRFYQYPFQFSGGMRQRIVIAIALTAAPDILICDEPTTALDVTIQAQILELINKLKRERHLSCIFITHDLGVVANMADRVAVMYAGKICEYGTDKEIFFDPRHPYTWALLSSIPDIDSKEKLEAIPGTPPDMIYPPVGDAFAQRNKYAMAIDFKYQPPYFKISDTHYAATWLLYKDAPKVEPPKIVTTRIRKSLEEEEKYGK
jgi:oligopeptide/dipeptide ABC transporter ATP-binding protein